MKDIHEIWYWLKHVVHIGKRWDMGRWVVECIERYVCDYIFVVIICFVHFLTLLYTYIVDITKRVLPKVLVV